MTVGHLEVGSNVGHVDVVALLEEVERLRINQKPKLHETEMDIRASAPR